MVRQKNPRDHLLFVFRQEISRLLDGLTIGLPLVLHYEFQRDDKILDVA
jgi:hypothetical protein